MMGLIPETAVNSAPPITVRLNQKSRRDYNNGNHFMNYAENILNAAFEGLSITDNANADQVATILDKYGLRWSVEKTPLLLPTGEETGFFGVVRTDNKKTFSTCKEGYTPYQNSELAELLVRISEKTGYEIHSGGEFNGGGKVYLQLNTGNEIKGIGENGTTVKGYVTGINSHDGTTSLKWGAVNFTVCCRNTFAAAGKQLQNSARHTQSIHDRVEQSIAQIEGVNVLERSIFDKFIKLSEVAVSKESIAKIVKNVTDVDITMSQAAAADKFSTYQLNRSNELLTSISKEMTQKGQTMWGLFSGVTHYTSHVLPTPKRDNARLESKYTGSALSIDNDAFATVLEMAGLN